jgi:hypothetical protein
MNQWLLEVFKNNPHNNMLSVVVGWGLGGTGGVYKPCKSWERNNGIHVTSMTTSFLSFQNLILTSLLLTGRLMLFDVECKYDFVIYLNNCQFNQTI